MSDIRNLSENIEQRKLMINQRLQNFYQLYGYPLFNTRSQRIHGPKPDATLPEPGTEVFIANIPQDLLEDELYHFLTYPKITRSGRDEHDLVQLPPPNEDKNYKNDIVTSYNYNSNFYNPNLYFNGSSTITTNLRVYKLRLMITASLVFNRGFAYVTYCTKQEASIAVQTLNGLQMRANSRIAVIKSRNNTRLFLGGIPEIIPQEEVTKELFLKNMFGMINVIVYKSIQNPNFNRGFAFIEFGTHQEAAAARTVFKNMTLYGKRVFLDWSKPEDEIEPNLLKNVKKLFLRQLPVFQSPMELKDQLEAIFIGSEIEIDRIYKHNDYSFVHFSTKLQAKNAYAILKDHFRSTDVIVEWAKPKIPTNGIGIKSNN